MMNYREILKNTSHKFLSLIDNFNYKEIFTENFGWDNFRYESDKLRLLHLERYTDDKLSVIHLTCFPRVWSEDPIFGFDVITTDKKVLAAFCDWSPILNDKTNISLYDYKKNYDLPEWAKNIFSSNAIAIVPQDEKELNEVCEESLKSFYSYIKDLSEIKSDRIEDIKIKQNYYCEQQQMNTSTFNVLKSKLGEDRARYFMENILFPKNM